jgi:hypothetical protein
MRPAVSSPDRKEKEALSHLVWLAAISTAYLDSSASALQKAGDFADR